MNDRMDSKKIIFFDFDGVITDSVGLSHKTYNLVSDPITMEEYLNLFNGNIYDTLVENKVVRKDNNPETYFEMYRPHILEQALFPGIKEVVASIHEKYPLMFIISSNSEPMIENYLKHHGLLSYFTRVLATETHYKKTVKIQNILDEYKIAPADAVVITDTLGDIREAAKVSVGSIAVTWGFHDAANLLKGDPHTVIELPEHLPDAVRDYFEKRL